MSTPIPDENQPMRETLQRDAAGVPKPDFDPALHHATMRRLRGLAEARTRQFRFGPMLATATAALVLMASWAFWPMLPSQENRAAAKLPLEGDRPPLAMPRTSLLTYQIAATQGDDALFALLDRDAREILPASAPIFNTPFH